MTRDEYGEILNKLWVARSYTKTAEDHMQCDHLLFGWLSLGVTVFRWVTRRSLFFSWAFCFDDQKWQFTHNKNLYGYSEIVEAGTWTPELMEKIRKHYDTARAAGQTIEDTMKMIEVLGMGKHPIPASDEDMLQRILKLERED